MVNRWRHWQGPAIAGALAGVLLLGQTLGLAHGVAHAPKPAQEAPALHQAHAVDCAEHSDLFAGHEQGSDVCELLDQIGHADLLPLATQAAAQPAPARHFTCAPAEGLAPRWAAAYNARAPPFFLA